MIKSVIATTAFLIWASTATVAFAQATTEAAPAQAAAKKHTYAEGTRETNPACQKLVADCKGAGYSIGGKEQGKGLWYNCFSPMITGDALMMDGKPSTLKVDKKAVDECRVVVQYKPEKKDSKKAAKKTSAPAAAH